MRGSLPIAVRFPFSALSASTGRNQCEIARILGLNRRSVVRAVARGLSPVQADRYAIGLGFHPLEVWPDYHDRIEARPKDADVIPR